MTWHLLQSFWLKIASPKATSKQMLKQNCSVHVETQPTQPFLSSLKTRAWTQWTLLLTNENEVCFTQRMLECQGKPDHQQLQKKYVEMNSKKWSTTDQLAWLTGMLSAMGSTGLWNGQAWWCLQHILITDLRYWSWLVTRPVAGFCCGVSTLLCRWGVRQDECERTPRRTNTSS